MKIYIILNQFSLEYSYLERNDSFGLYFKMKLDESFMEMSELNDNIIFRLVSINKKELKLTNNFYRNIVYYIC